jgi:multidrug efflux pump subunit AcrA (membrane-fusion protein)
MQVPTRRVLVRIEYRSAYPDPIQVASGDQVRVGREDDEFRATLEQALGNLKRDQAQAENAKAEANRYTDLEKQGRGLKRTGGRRRTRTPRPYTPIKQPSMRPRFNFNTVGTSI